MYFLEGDNLRFFMKKLKNVLFIIYFMFLMSFNTYNIYASDITDIGKINDGFTFSEDVDNDMSFNGIDKSKDTDFFNNLYDKYKFLILGTLGILIMLFLVLFISNIMKLNIYSDKPELRSKYIMNILWTGIAFSLLGSIVFIVAISKNLLK